MAFAVNQLFITNDVPLTIVPTLKIPNAAAPVEPTVNLDKKINEFVVTAVVATIADPPTKTTDPKLFATAAVVVPTFAESILLPEVTKFKLPVTFILVAVKLTPPEEPPVNVTALPA